MFISKRKIINEGLRTTGTVTDTKKCWWIKINTKPVRTHYLDGAKFPHIITFTYSANGAEYTGKKMISYAVDCPPIGYKLSVYYLADKPEKCALDF